jgi:LysM repeat protein
MSSQSLRMNPRSGLVDVSDIYIKSLEVCWQKIKRGLLLLVLFISLQVIRPALPVGVWGSRPLLSYFGLTASLEEPLRTGVPLSPAEFGITEEIAKQELDNLFQNFQNSQAIVNDPTISSAEKSRRIADMGYNRKVDEIISTSDQHLRQSLSDNTYHRLVSWIEQRWPVEQAFHGRPYASSVGSGTAAVRSYQVYATRFESKGGAYVVALPDQCLKLANGGLHTCDSKGYVAGSSYSVAISYKKGIGVLVGDAGPWNIDDNFWATISDPQPRRLFADLALGMSEAQAAYYNGYNGGKDQYGRKVTAPFAIDLAFKVGDDIGLPPKKNDWITVSFLWTADWGGKKSNTGKQDASTPGSQTETTPAAIPMIITSTPAADGSITHIVKAGETLWTIAVAYHVRTAEIQYLNNMGQAIVIYEGQKLKIKEAGPTWTPMSGAIWTARPALTTTITTTLTASPTGSLTPSPGASTEAAIVNNEQTTKPETTPSPGIQASPPATSTSLSSGQASSKSPFKPTSENLMIAALGLVGFGLILFATGWLSSKGKKGVEDDTDADGK